MRSLLIILSASRCEILKHQPQALPLGYFGSSELKASSSKLSPPQAARGIAWISGVRQQLGLASAF